MKKNKKEDFRSRKVKKRRIIIVTSLFLGIIIVSLFSTQLALYLNFLIGNDVVVKLEADKHHLYLNHSEEGVIKFEEFITTNPFCSAECEYKFIDISNNEVIETNNFISEKLTPLHKEFTIKADKLGVGQKLYRFDLNCLSKKTLLCHTNEKPSTKSILITVNYDLNEEEQNLKTDINKKLDELSFRLGNLKREEKKIEKEFYTINKFFILEKLDYSKEELYQLDDSFKKLDLLWINYDYSSMKEELIEVKQSIEEYEKLFEDVNNSLFSYKETYNSLIDSIYDSKNDLEILKNQISSDNISIEFNKTISYYNNLTYIFLEEKSLEKKTEIVNIILSKVNNIKKKNDEELLKLSSYLYEKREELCLLTGECLFTNVSSLNETCSELSRIKSKLEEVDKIVKLCDNIEQDNIKIKEINFSKINFDENLEEIELFKYGEPKKECCIFGVCEECCTSQECKNNPELYPVILLHGHAFNEEVSADYSLEWFNGIQNRLESDGYLNAGTVTLYTGFDYPQGVLSLITRPITKKVSYYFDVVKDSEDYTMVQTKSQNIDTYSIKLKELIDIVKYQTDKPKVNIVAFSMGGLVARRYLQIFGENEVNKLILIGTPNKGIKGEVTDYCNLFGEKLECDDMDSKSLFINKLNTGKQPSIPIYNIIGTGCQMELGIGDGVVLEKDAKLHYANNFVVEGECNNNRLLHIELGNIDNYPNSYKFILESLKE